MILVHGIHSRKNTVCLSLPNICPPGIDPEFVMKHIVLNCKNGKPHKTCKCALCTVDDTCCFHDIRLGPKTSVYEKNVSLKSTVAHAVM